MTKDEWMAIKRKSAAEIRQHLIFAELMKDARNFKPLSATELHRKSYQNRMRSTYRTFYYCLILPLLIIGLIFCIVSFVYFGLADSHSTVHHRIYDRNVGIGLILTGLSLILIDGFVIRTTIYHRLMKPLRQPKPKLTKQQRKFKIWRSVTISFLILLTIGFVTAAIVFGGLEGHWIVLKNVPNYGTAVDTKLVIGFGSAFVGMVFLNLFVFWPLIRKFIRPKNDSTIEPDTVINDLNLTLFEEPVKERPEDTIYTN